jgi:hypothetical protein
LYRFLIAAARMIAEQTRIERARRARITPTPE